MRSPGRALIPILLVSVVAIVGGCGSVVPGGRDGQIVFVPVGALPGGSDEGGGSLTIRRCEPTPNGLRIEGFVAVRGGVTAVAVSGGPESDPGVAVGAAFASQAQLSSEARNPGDFVVTVPWADPSVRMQEVDPDSLESRRPLTPFGPVVRCPED